MTARDMRTEIFQKWTSEKLPPEIINITRLKSVMCM